MSSIKVYGISNCDTVKKAFKFLKYLNIPFEFHDYKKTGISEAKLKEWISVHPESLLLNKKSTTWRSLSREEQQEAESKQGALKLMQEYPTLIKRPVAEISGTILLGFNEAAYITALN